MARRQRIRYDWPDEFEELFHALTGVSASYPWIGCVLGLVLAGVAVAESHGEEARGFCVVRAWADLIDGSHAKARRRKEKAKLNRTGFSPRVCASA
jgi:hypothetical protein